jgi:hypothetical protein
MKAVRVNGVAGGPRLGMTTSAARCGVECGVFEILETSRTDDA